MSEEPVEGFPDYHQQKMILGDFADFSSLSKRMSEAVHDPVPGYRFELTGEPSPCPFQDRYSTGNGHAYHRGDGFVFCFRCGDIKKAT